MTLLNKTLFFSFTISTLLTSCGPSGITKTVTKTKVGTILDESSTMIGQDHSNASRTCEAFRFKKSHILLNNKIGRTFRFKLTQDKCEGPQLSESVSSELSSINVIGGYMFTPQKEPILSFFREMQSNTHGYMATLCDRILLGEKDIGLSIVNNSALRVDLSFTDKYFLVSKAKKNEQDNFEVYETEEFHINFSSEDTSANSKHGMVMKTIFSKKCSNNKVINYTQILK